MCCKFTSGNPNPLFKLIFESRKGNPSSTIARLCDTTDDLEIANCSTNLSQSVFTKDNGSLPNLESIAMRAPARPKLVCTEKSVLNLLEKVDHCKGLSSDGLSPSLLKYTAPLIAPILTTIFNLLQTPHALRQI